MVHEILNLMKSRNLYICFIGMIDAHNRCDQAGENGITRLAGVRCPNGLAFDIDRQTCDWKTRVKNCDKLDSKYDTDSRRRWFTDFKRCTHH